MNKAFEGVDLPLGNSLIVEGSDEIRLLELR